MPPPMLSRCEPSQTCLPSPHLPAPPREHTHNTPRHRAFARIAETRCRPGNTACEEGDTYHQFDPLGRAIVGRQCVALAFATGVHGRENWYAKVWNQSAIVIKRSRAVCDRVLGVERLLSQSMIIPPGTRLHTIEARVLRAGVART